MSLKWKDIGKPELETSAGSLSGNVWEGHFLVEMGLSTAIVMISVLFQPGPSARQSGLMRINPPQGLKEEIRGGMTQRRTGGTIFRGSLQKSKFQNAF